MSADTTAAAGEAGWTELAASDDRVVAELLLRLRCSDPRSSRRPAPPLDWTVRQPRTGGPKKEKDKDKDMPMRMPVPTRKEEEEELKQGAVEPTRASPTTPLSWSGATSTSGGCAEGQEESSRADRPPYMARSKVVVSYFDSTANSTSALGSSKRPKRKKTLAELKEEADSLLKEQRNLRHALETLRRTAEQERTRQEIFKRKKLDMESHHRATVAAAGDTKPGRAIMPLQSQDGIGVAETLSGLPDLNILPPEEHSWPSVLYRAN